MPKTNAEKCREYWQRKKILKKKQVAKSSTERVHEFRARRKALLNGQHNISIAHNNTSNVQNSENDNHNSQLDVLNVQGDASIGHNIESNDSINKLDVMRKTRSQTQAESGQASANGSLSQRGTAQGIRRPPIPADYETRNKIAYFRVFELQKILTALNVSHIGRKTELQKRLYDLLATNYTEVAAKILEVYQASSQEERNNQEFGGPDPKRMYQPQIQLPVQSDIRATIVGNNIMVPYSTHMTSGYPIHPDVRLKKLAFYDVLATLLQPATLVPNSAQRMQEASFYFTLTPQQATEIASNRDIRCGSKIEHIIQVQLRFCLLETSCEQDDCFPPNVILKVNNKLCPLPNPIPTNRPNVEPKRPPRPVNVTSNVKLSPTVTNGITVQWCADSPRGYVIAAYLVRKLTSAQLLHRMKTKGVKPADYTRSLIKEKLNEDADCEIATTMLKVSLICPLGKMRMTIPCRASTCSHLQCFDASLYLQMNERKPTWNCPVCDKAAIYETLVIDGYFQEVLASSMLTSDDNEIQLHKDGSWSTQIMRNDTQILDTPNKQVQKVEVISDDLEVITTEVEEKPATPASPAPPSLTVHPVINNNEPTSTTTNDTVDLTLSDSDDDLPLKRRAAARANNNANGNGQKAAPLPTKVKQNDNLSSSIISLDSPSPPSSPNPDASKGGYSSTGVTSTTTPFSTSMPTLNSFDIDSTGGTTSSKYQINPMAISRFDNQSINTSLALQRYLTDISGHQPAHSNLNIVHPYREADDQSNK